MLRKAEAGARVVVCAVSMALGYDLLQMTQQVRWDDGPIESCYGKFRDECLNQNVFFPLYDAHRTVETWRQDYNQR